jgi:hypothetical protein
MRGGELMTLGNGCGGNAAPDVTLYIASLAGELARLATRHDLDALAYILHMARLEADRAAAQHAADPSEPPGTG